MFCTRIRKKRFSVCVSDKFVHVRIWIKTKYKGIFPSKNNFFRASRSSETPSHILKNDQHGRLHMYNFFQNVGSGPTIKLAEKLHFFEVLGSSQWVKTEISCLLG